MQSAIERRQQVLEAISDRRTERIENLAAEFGVSRRTIERDMRWTTAFIFSRQRRIGKQAARVSMRPASSSCLL